MSDKIISFPGIKPDHEDITVEKLLETLQQQHKLRSVVLVGIIDATGEVMVSGNTTVSQGVYLLEVGKLIIMNSD